MGWKVLTDVKPYLAMVLLQVGFAGMYIIAVASLKAGMSHFVLVVYRNIMVQAALVDPNPVKCRGRRPKMTTSIVLKIMGLAILEPVIDQNLYFLGAKLTSAGFATALLNTLPAITFLLALILRMEKGVVSRQRGPVFVTAFNPLCMIITAVMGSIILKEEITLGSVIGAVIIVAGLYFLIWGKSKDDISQVSDVTVKVAGELPLTSVTNGHGHGKQHELGNGNGGHVDVETPATNGHY
uniref:WAT1-related protein n=1 Tax=Aegilops tauschii TaxID=37682 RepID=M8BCB9_AEGTA